ncbi:SNF2-related protein [Actinomadura sp. KC06]|uniref:SNF2-related protein n=1 Tax=Actinomadura sp. KC06 TaxID=2530369 RepID=UPI001404D7E8|nr:SNF2-related protein [Actinomadura sp. KC06]
MGLGKCLGKDEFVYVNGTLIKAKDIWARFANGSSWDGEGEWSVPTETLTVNSIAKDGRIVPAPIARLYRQYISEKVREVRLDDGSRIILTRRHSLLGVEDWTNDIRPGMRVCVPTRLRHEGASVDEDLTVLLAWQIAEGSEDRWTSVVITQKDVRVLEDLRARLLRIAERFGLQINNPKIVPSAGRRAFYLRFSGAQYRELLEERGYRWWGNSAHKRIPECLTAADDATVRTFLRHYFAAESSVDTSRRVVEISSASVWIMRQLSMMLRRFGVWLRISTSWKCATNGSGTKRPYQIGLIGGPSLRRFDELVGIADPAKQARLDEICTVPPNTNVEGVPGSDLLKRAHEETGLPMRHFGVRTGYFYGTQELSREKARDAIDGMDRILSGKMESEYATRKGNKWTERTLASYRNLDRICLQKIRDSLAERAAREVFYAKIVSVEDVDYEGYVYDFEVADHHNYVAEGMLCHNTAQTLALLASEREGGERPGPTLLIGPMSLVGNWQRETARFTPKLRVYVHHGTGRHRGEDLIEAVAGADLVLTTYGTATRDAEMLARIEWGRVVCDEAQALKNSGTRQARAVRSIPARNRIALTGTPVENHLTELWSIMEFANPGLLGPRAAFRQRFAIPIERDGDEQAALALKRATQPFVLRRLKTDKSIISDLPEKQEIKVYCNLTTEQASLYQATVDDMLAQIAEADEKNRRGLVLATMAKLKQVCNHPAQLLKDGSRLPGRSGKLERLEEICAEVLEQGEKALVFTQYAEFGSMLQPYLAARLERPVLWLHGGTSKQGRDDLVQRFQDDAEPAIFLLSLKAAGTGLTLTAANHVVHVDRWWNPAVEDQATDRAFRIGQTRNVQVRKFICVGTMEERVDEMIERKKALADSIVGTGEDWLTELSVAELRDVLRLSPEAVSD